MPDHTDDYRTLNRASWDERAPAHPASPGYHSDEFRGDPTYRWAEVVQKLLKPGGEHRLADRPWRLPHTYTIRARKPA